MRLLCHKCTWFAYSAAESKLVSIVYGYQVMDRLWRKSSFRTLQCRVTSTPSFWKSFSLTQLRTLGIMRYPHGHTTNHISSRCATIQGKYMLLPGSLNKVDANKSA